MKKFTTTLVLLLAAFMGRAQETPTANGTAGNGSKFIVSANVSFAYRLGSLPDGIDATQEKYLKGLKSGISYDLSLYYRVHEQVAVGLKYNTFRSKSSVSGVDYTDYNGQSYSNATASDDIAISFYGPSILVDFAFPESRTNLAIESALGYIQYKDTQGLGNEYIMKGGSVGGTLGINYKYEAFSNFFVGPQLNLVTGSITKMKITGNGYSDTYTLKGKNAESLTRIDLGVTVTYGF